MFSLFCFNFYFANHSNDCFRYKFTQNKILKQGPSGFLVAISKLLKYTQSDHLMAKAFLVILMCLESCGPCGYRNWILKYYVSRMQAYQVLLENKFVKKNSVNFQTKKNLIITTFYLFLIEAPIRRLKSVHSNNSEIVSSFRDVFKSVNGFDI